jgi:CarD family transcriptional regulator
MTFAVGEKVVYPNQGVATIENISTRSFGVRPERYYLLRLASNHLTILVPFSHVDDVGLRKVTRNGHVEQVLRFLANGECTGCRDWKNRFKENSEKMRNGGLMEVAEVLKGLLRLQGQKPLSFREKKISIKPGTCSSWKCPSPAQSESPWLSRFFRTLLPRRAWRCR